MGWPLRMRVEGGTNDGDGGTSPAMTRRVSPLSRAGEGETALASPGASSEQGCEDVLQRTATLDSEGSVSCARNGLPETETSTWRMPGRISAPDIAVSDRRTSPNGEL